MIESPTKDLLYESQDHSTIFHGAFTTSQDDDRRHLHGRPGSSLSPTDPLSPLICACPFPIRAGCIPTCAALVAHAGSKPLAYDDLKEIQDLIGDSWCDPLLSKLCQRWNRPSWDSAATSSAKLNLECNGTQARQDIIIMQTIVKILPWWVTRKRRVVVLLLDAISKKHLIVIVQFTFSLVLFCLFDRLMQKNWIDMN